MSPHPSTAPLTSSILPTKTDFNASSACAWTSSPDDSPLVEFDPLYVRGEGKGLLRRERGHGVGKGEKERGGKGCDERN